MSFNSLLNFRVITVPNILTSGQSNLTKAASPPHMDGSIVFALHLIHDFFGPLESTSQNGISICSAVLAQITVESPYTLQGAPLFPSKLPLHMGIWTPSNTLFLGPTRVHNPNSISIVSAVFAELATVRDRKTDRPTN